jgi:hypothetical protein
MIFEPISSGAGKHLVDAEYVVGVEPYSQMEGILTSGLGNVLVSSNTGSFKSLAGQLLILQRYQVNAEREVIYMSSLTSNIVDPNLGIGDTTAVARLDVSLTVAISVAICH